MSIGNIMNTSTAGMNVQASKLSVVSENIANSDTRGYKRSETEFSSLVLPQTTGGYTSGSVAAVTRNTISQSGGLSYTGNSSTAQKLDLAVDGDGFFVVGDDRANYLTRAGSFTMQADGTMVNTAGYTLKGYPIGAKGTDAVLNGFAGLQDVNLQAGLLNANASTQGTLTVPLDQAYKGAAATLTQSSAFGVTVAPTATGTQSIKVSIKVNGVASATEVTITPTSPKTLADLTAKDIADAINAETGLSGVASVDSGKLVLKSNLTTGTAASKIEITAVATTPTSGITVTGLATGSDTGSVRPSANSSSAVSSDATIQKSITVYNKAGEAVKLDVYYTKTGTDTWEMAVYDGRDAAAGTSAAPFPYSTAAISVATLTFDPDKAYALKTITPVPPTTQGNNKVLGIDLSSIGGGNFNLDIGNTTQLFKPDTSALAARVNGNPPEVIKTISIGKDGVVTALFTSGSSRDLYKIPLGKVASPDSLTAVSGNAYQVGVASGTVLMGTGGENGFGNVTAGALENSNVDLATELTNMITAQRSYTANSKVFQTGSEILDVLVNLKR